MGKFKRKKILIIAAVFALTLCFSMVTAFIGGKTASASFIYPDGGLFEDWESYSVGNVPVGSGMPMTPTFEHQFAWNPSFTPTGLRVTADPANSAGKALRIGGMTALINGCWGSTRSLPKYNQQFTVSMDYYFPTLLLAGEDTIINLNTNGAWQQIFKIAPDGGANKLMPFSGAAWPAATVPLSEWFRVVVEADCVNLRFNIYLETGIRTSTVTRVTAASNQLLNANFRTNGLDFFRIGSTHAVGQSTAFYFDNMYVRPVWYRPTADNLKIEGTGRAGETLTAMFDYEQSIYYTDNYYHESGSTYQWYSAAPEQGKEHGDLIYTAIDGATSKTYTLTADEIGKYIRFEVTPTGETGLAGNTVTSTGMFSVFKKNEDFETVGAFAQNYFKSENSITVTHTGDGTGNNAVKFTPTGETGNASFENSVYYQGFTVAFGYSMKINIEKNLTGGVFRSSVRTKTPGSAGYEIECFNITGGMFYQEGGAFSLFGHLSKWITVKVIFAESVYYTEVLDGGTPLYKGPSVMIHDSDFIESYAVNGVTHIKNEYAISGVASAAFILIDDISIGNISDYFILVSEDAGEIPTFGAFEYAFTYLYSGQGTLAVSYQITDGALPSGLSLAGNKISGAPTQTGAFTITVRATADAYTSYALFSVNVANAVVVAFETNGGVAMNPVYILPGRVLIGVDAPEYDDTHRFVGWYTEASFENEFIIGTDIVTDSMTLYAKWLVAVRLSFNIYCGPAMNDEYVFPGDEMAEKIPAWENHRFLGWYKDGQFTDAWDFENDVVGNTDFTLHANWLAAVRLSYNVNGGIAMETEYVYPDDPLVEVPAVRDGYLFVLWFKDTALLSAWDFDTEVVPDADFTLHALWSIETYLVYFISPQGHGATFVKIDFNGKLTAPALSDVKGFTFEGWYVGSDFSQKWDFNSGVASNMELFAKFTQDGDSVGGVGCSNSASFVPALLLLAGLIALQLKRRA